MPNADLMKVAEAARARAKAAEVVGTLSPENEAIHEVAFGRTNLKPSLLKPKHENEKPAHDPAAPDLPEDSDDPDAPEVLTSLIGKELTPAQKAAEQLAISMGFVPETKVLTPRDALIVMGTAAGAGTLAGGTIGYGAGRRRGVKKGQEPLRRLLAAIPPGGEARIRRVAPGAAQIDVKSAEQLAKEFYQLESEEKRLKLPKGFLRELLQTGGAAVGTTAAGVGIYDRFRKGKKSADELAREFYLEQGEKGKMPAWLKSKIYGGARLIKDEIRRQPLQTAAGLGIAGASVPLIVTQQRNAKRQQRLFNLMGMKEGVKPSELVFGVKDVVVEEEEVEVAPDQLAAIKDELDLTPMEEQLLTQMVAEGAGVESVEAGAVPAEVLPPAVADNLPATGMEAFGQSPVQTSPGDELELPGVAAPEGDTYQSSELGSPTSEAAPASPGAPIVQAAGTAVRSTVGAPPMDKDEAEELGQSEEEAFASLVAKLERLQEEAAVGGVKSLEDGEKAIGALIAKLASRAIGAIKGFGARAAAKAPNTLQYARQLPGRVDRAVVRSTNRLGNVVAGTGQIRGGVLGRAMERTGNFAAARPRTTAGIAAGVTGVGLTARELQERRRRALNGY